MATDKSIIIDGCNVIEERKFLIHTDKYSIGEDGLIDSEIPFTDICYDLALQLKRLKDKLEKISYRFKQTKKANKQYKTDIKNLQAELEQYKKSKQASYESMQREWNYAVNELRDVKAENENLKAEVKEIRTLEELKLSKYRKALEDIKNINNSSCINKVRVINATINEVLD